MWLDVVLKRLWRWRMVQTPTFNKERTALVDIPAVSMPNAGSPKSRPWRCDQTWWSAVSGTPVSNQHLDMAHLPSGMDYLSKELNITDLDLFGNNIGDKWSYCAFLDL